MFTAAERDRVRALVLSVAETDDDVVAAAITGSHASGSEDEWSDVDLAFAVRGALEPALARWTDHLYRDLGALHHWDLASGSSVYRVFLLPNCLEIDIAFTPEADFAPRGPAWRTVFGEAGELAEQAAPDVNGLVGLAWHHVLHARAAIERGKPWQAEHWISAVRDHVLSLACVRLGYPARYGKGADLLPAAVLRPLEVTLPSSLAEAELRRTLAAVSGALLDELKRTDASLAERLRPVLAERGGTDQRYAPDRPASLPSSR